MSMENPNLEKVNRAGARVKENMDEDVMTRVKNGLAELGLAIEYQAKLDSLLKMLQRNGKMDRAQDDLAKLTHFFERYQNLSAPTKVLRITEERKKKAEAKIAQEAMNFIDKIYGIWEREEELQKQEREAA